MNSLEKILVTPLARISTPGGDVLHGIKSNEKTFNGFGEAYFSYIEPKTIKAWKLHNKMTMNLIVPSGTVKFVFCDLDNYSFRMEIIGESNFSRITVPAGIWFGFQGLDNAKPSLVFNLTDIQHDPNEVSRKTIADIDFKW